MKKTPLAKIWRKHKARIANWWSEKAVFSKLIEERGRTDTSWKLITKESAQSFQFAHILPKGMYPEFRLDPNNIVIVDSIAQHNWVDSIVAWFKYEFKEMVLKGTAVKAIHDLYVSQFSWLE